MKSNPTSFIRVIGCGVIILFGISTFAYPINPRFGTTIIGAGIILYVITD